MTRESLTTGRQAARFLGIGTANTVLTALAFYLLAGIVGAPLAYVCAYGLGILFAGLVVPSVVFGRPASLAISGRVATGYAGVLVFGFALVALLDRVLGFDRVAIVAVTLAITVPLNFVVARAMSGSAP